MMTKAQLKTTTINKKEHVMRNRLSKIKRYIGYTVISASYLFVTSVSYAANAGGGPTPGSDATFGKLFTTINGFFTGAPADILSLTALGGGIVGAMATRHKAASIALAAIVPIAIQCGPALFESLSGAVL